MSDYIKRLFLSLACLHEFETVSPLERIDSSFVLKCRKCGKVILMSEYRRYEL